MSFRNNNPAQSRGFYYDPSALDDLLSGETRETPKQIPQSAIDAAFALVPTPSETNIAQVSAAQAGPVTGTIVLQDGILFDGEGTILTADDTVAVTLASFLQCKLPTVINNEVNGVCFDIDGLESVGVVSEFMVVGGTDGIGVRIRGTCNRLFLTSSLVTVTGLRGTVLDVTGTSDVPIDANADTIELNEDDSVFVNYNPDNATDVLSMNVSSVVSASGVTGEVGFHARAGTLILENVGVIDLETISHIHNGATVICNHTSLKGNLIIDVGGTLEIDTTSADVTISGEGTINGRIGDTLFGTWATQQLAEFDANDANFPSSNPAAASSINGHPTVKFNAGVDQSVIFQDVMSRGYSGDDFNVRIPWVAATVTTGDVDWGIEIEAMPDGFNIGSDSFDTRQTETTTAPETSQDIVTTVITLTNAEADDITAGSPFRLKLTRVGISDTMTDDAHALRVVVEQ